MADILSSFISQVKIGDNIYPVGSSLFGLSTSAANSADKVVNANNLTNDSFATLATGITVHIKFQNGNAAEAPITLKVGSTAAKPVINPGGELTWNDGAIITFTYDGTSWVMNGGKSIVDVSEGINDGEIVIGSTTVKPKNIADAAFYEVDTSITSGTTSGNLPTSQAVANYVDEITSNLTGVMHFKGALNSLPTATDATTFQAYDAGDVVLVDQKEYVYNKGATAAASEWILLGDEGSYALKSSTANIGSASGWNAGTVPTLGTDITADDITAWSANVPTTANVSNGTLVISAGTAASLTYTEKSIPNITSVGTAPSLTVTDTVVVKP